MTRLNSFNFIKFTDPQRWTSQRFKIDQEKTKHSTVLLRFFRKAFVGPRFSIQHIGHFLKSHPSCVGEHKDDKQQSEDSPDREEEVWSAGAQRFTDHLEVASEQEGDEPVKGCTEGRRLGLHFRGEHLPHRCPGQRPES